MYFLCYVKYSIDGKRSRGLWWRHRLWGDTCKACCYVLFPSARFSAFFHGLYQGFYFFEAVGQTGLGNAADGCQFG